MILFDLLIQTDPNPWFDARSSAMIGGIGGSVGGVLGALVGTSAGVLAPQGKGRRFVLGTMMVGAGLGVASLLTGIVAVILGQPYHVWYPMVLLGAVLGGVMGGLIPVVRRRYMEAEQRRLDADALRRS